MTGRKILVADDDDSARALAQKFLEGKGHSVTAVADGEAVVAALRDGEFDAVILDVMMPKLSGFEVLATVRAAGDTTPIIMATAAARVEDTVRALQMGADDYVTKPYSFTLLLARMELRMRLRPAPQPAQPPPRPALPVAADTEAMDRVRGIAQRWRKGPAPVARLAPGAVVADRYVIGELIGEGGYGVVWRAQHVDLGQDVALKVLHAGASSTVDAFRREAQNACRVRHNNAVRVLDFGLLPGGNAFLVMELLNGPSLESVLVERGPMAVRRAAGIVRPVLSALAAAHRQGIVHRDVKPQNVVLHKEDDGQEIPKLLDFGIAKDLDSAVSDSGGVVLGSPAYVAPERLVGARYDGRADVYACGIMLFRMLTGVLPFDLSLDDFEPVALWHINSAAPAPSQRVPALAGAVDDVVMRMMSKDPARRPTASEAELLLAGLR